MWGVTIPRRTDTGTDRHGKSSLTPTRYVSVPRFSIPSVPGTFPYHIFKFNPYTLRFRNHILKSYPYSVNREHYYLTNLYTNFTKYSTRTRTKISKINPYTSRFRTSIFKSFRTLFWNCILALSLHYTYLDTDTVRSTESVPVLRGIGVTHALIRSIVG